MDQLDDKERVSAWKAIWNPSFSGMAIMNEDFTFRSVNPQFCKLLGVTPAELIGQKFSDVTPINIRSLEEKNAKLLKAGQIPFYILPKKYEFQNGLLVDVVQLVTKAISAKDGEEVFFVSRIMLDKKESVPKAKKSKSTAPSPKLMITVVDFLMKYWIWIATASAMVVGIANEFFQMALF